MKQAPFLISKKTSCPCLLFFFFMLATSLLHATPLSYEVFCNDTLNIGQPIVYRFTFPITMKAQIDAINQFDNKSLEITKTHNYRNFKNRVFDVYVACFDTGRVEVPSFRIMIQKNKDQSFYATLPRTIVVKEISKAKELNLRDIANNLTVHWGFLDYLLPVVLLLLLFIVIRSILKIKKIKALKAQGFFEEVDTRPAYLITLEKLEILLQKRNTSSISDLDFHFELSQVLRFFLYKHFDIKALEMTTYELKQILPTDFPDRRAIIDFLQFLDKIKFAKFKPDTQLTIDAIKWLRQYLNSFAVLSAIQQGDNNA